MQTELVYYRIQKGSGTGRRVALIQRGRKWTQVLLMGETSTMKVRKSEERHMDDYTDGCPKQLVKAQKVFARCAKNANSGTVRVLSERVREMLGVQS